MKKFYGLMSVLIAALICMALTTQFGCNDGGDSGGPPTLDTKKLGELITLKVNVADVVDFTQKNNFGIPWLNWGLPIGGTRVLFILKGDCLLTTDIKAATYKSVDKDKRTFTMVLQEPVVKSARVNHDPKGNGGSYFYSVSPLGINILMPGDGNRTQAINAAMVMAQDKVIAAGKSQEVVKAAKENAARVIQGMYSGLDWTLTVEWK